MQLLSNKQYEGEGELIYVCLVQCIGLISVGTNVGIRL